METRKFKVPGTEKAVETKYTYSQKAVPPDDPKKIKLDAVLFNEKEWYEVAPVITKVFSSTPRVSDIVYPAMALNSMEDAIRNRPKDVATHVEVYEYLVKARK
jgi:hypothetical protein